MIVRVKFKNLFERDIFLFYIYILTSSRVQRFFKIQLPFATTFTMLYTLHTKFTINYSTDRDESLSCLFNIFYTYTTYDMISHSNNVGSK